ncbi:hypothetical protein Dthio_PD0163 [Desulfonatronospira thiodismutans ASO3-1]|uniref:Uncharacterized protein n=1 Tax=Desulfonatronospira thiodismutans ASO3-1 TaxID=555779 RepID=D6SU76_9BACT|nr:hypothetical protein Dthio_PD0163 [Desulfonatronospira thiodismutans ASO3-1]
MGNSALSLPISCMACFGQLSTSFTHFKQCTNWATHRLLPGIYLPHFMHGILWAIKATLYPFQTRYTLGNSAPSLPISCMACFGQFSTSFTHFRQRTNWATHRLLPGIYLPHFMHGILWAAYFTGKRTAFHSKVDSVPWEKGQHSMLMMDSHSTARWTAFHGKMDTFTMNSPL